MQQTSTVSIHGYKWHELALTQFVSSQESSCTCLVGCCLVLGRVDRAPTKTDSQVVPAKDRKFPILSVLSLDINALRSNTQKAIKQHQKTMNVTENTQCTAHVQNTCKID